MRRLPLNRWVIALVLSTPYSVLSTSPAEAHPVPRGDHDRTIAVRLAQDAKTGQVVVTVDYRLEVDELTVILEDMEPFKDEVDFRRFRGKPDGFYGEFTRPYGPPPPGNL